MRHTVSLLISMISTKAWPCLLPDSSTKCSRKALSLVFWDKEYKIWESELKTTRLSTLWPEGIFNHNVPALDGNCIHRKTRSRKIFLEVLAQVIAGPVVPIQYGHSWMKSQIQARKNQDSSVPDPREELKAYLDSPLEDVDDVVTWWR
ncbi:hypothetical protein B0H13DRAFT_1869559 [Mycena leptocephala]|nr:hypothetical protein B0H13DRAFT_1869559 [Mycena leptocephala]